MAEETTMPTPGTENDEEGTPMPEGDAPAPAPAPAPSDEPEGDNTPAS